jgi:hypothetical protein
MGQLFPLPIIIPPMFHPRLSPEAGTIDTSEAAVPRDSVLATLEKKAYMFKTCRLNSGQSQNKKVAN